MPSRKHNPGRRKPRVTKSSPKASPAPKKKRAAKKRRGRSGEPSPARRHSSGRRRPRPASPVARAGGVSTDAVRKATGFGWDHWLSVLDAFDVKAHGHKAAAEFLAREHKVGDWWAQMVVVGYEQARGLRQKHQKTDGFSVSVSRTLDVPAVRVFDAWSDELQRAEWLTGAWITIRKATSPKSLRLTWNAGEGLPAEPRATSVEVNIYAKGEDRCQVSVQHNKLAAASDVEKMRAFWTRAIEALRAMLGR
ncbi:MAG: hypothetical protein JNL50_02900 [Phycisphaerae bacterium]|nr:hypothetical protein [Phycisphaerae bacterium]